MKRLFNYITVLSVIFFLSIPTTVIGKKLDRKIFNSVDSIMTTQLSDSITNIILNAQNIEVGRLKDIASGKKSISCSKELKSITKCVFTFVDFAKPQYLVYGTFNPYIKYSFFNKKESCSIEIDFGLKQFRLLDNKGTDMGTFAYSGKGLLKLSAIFFPDDEFINFMLNQE